MKNLETIREKMKLSGIDYYIIPSEDAHQSEYVSDYYKGRAYVSGFTGSAGTILIGLEEAYLWTDGRYFIQAEREIKNKGIKLMKMRTPGYPTLEEWVKENIRKNMVLAFDGEVISASKYEEFYEISNENEFEIKMDKDLLTDIWKDRPELSKKKIFIHEMKFAGKSVSEKIQDVRADMNLLDGENYIIASLDDIAWLFNIRGNDIDYNPVALSFALINNSEAVLYIDTIKVDKEVKEQLSKEGVTIKEYKEIYNDVKDIKNSVIIDPDKINSKIYVNLPGDIDIIETANITTYLKAIKNEVEVDNIENAQVRDGVAMVKFTKWLKENVGKEYMDEISASDKLEELRAQGSNFKGLSFNTIAGYKDHAAMMHYSASSESKYELKREGMFLVDSGAQYLDGTTDITRTFVLGNITEEEKRDFTLVLKGHIALASAVFLKGSTGQNLDILARGPLWKYGIDYKCGTGHGVGYFLNVHEGPQQFRQTGNHLPLEKGMVITNEPGVYKEDRYGIRIENMLLVTECFKDDINGEFYKFNSISYCPIDLDGVNVEMLTFEEKQWLNKYHSMVYDKVSPYLNEEEKIFLKYETREI